MEEIVEIFDLKGVANEVYCYLTVYLFPPHPPPEMHKFIQDLEHLLKELILATIDLHCDRVIRKNVSEAHDLKLCKFCGKYGINKHYFELILDDLYSVAYILDRVVAQCIKNPFNLWILDKSNGVYIFQCLGDFRILTWEQEHLVNGKYVP